MKSIYYQDLETLPPIDFQDKNFFEIAMSRVNTTKMTPLEIAYYENSIMRNKAEADFWKKKSTQRKMQTIKKRIIEKIKKGVQLDYIKLNKIADNHDVGIDFVRSVIYTYFDGDPFIIHNASQKLTLKTI